jgi:hypothetical protein
MSTAESLKKLLDEFTEKQGMLDSEREVVEQQIAALEGRLGECNRRLQLVAVDREKILAFKERYGPDYTSNGGSAAGQKSAESSSEEKGSEAGAPHIEAVKPERRTLFTASRVAGKEETAVPLAAPEPTTRAAKSLFAKAAKAQAAAQFPEPAAEPAKLIEPPVVSVPDRSHTQSAPPAAAAQEPVAPVLETPAVLLETPAALETPPAALETPPVAPPIPERVTQKPEVKPESAPPVHPEQVMPPLAETPSWLKGGVSSQVTSDVPRPDPPPAPPTSAVERFSAQFAKETGAGGNTGWSGGMDAELPVPQVETPAAAPSPPVPPAVPMPTGGINSLLADLSSDHLSEPIPPVAPLVAPPVASPVPPVDVPPGAPAQRSGIDSLLRRPGANGAPATGELPRPDEATPGSQQAVFGDAAQTFGSISLQPAFPEPVQPSVPVFGDPASGGWPQPAPAPAVPPQAMPPQPMPPQPAAPPQPVAPQGGPPQPKGPPAPVPSPVNQGGGGWPAPPDQPAAQPQTIDLNSQEGQEEEGDGDTVKSINDALRSLFR